MAASLLSGQRVNNSNWLLTSAKSWLSEPDSSGTWTPTPKSLIWRFYADLRAYRANPTARRRGQLRARFDRIFRRRTGFVTLDRLLARLHANKAELLAVLDHPDIPLHTNGSENDIRCQVTKRKVSGGTRSDIGRDCRDAFLGLARTCAKLGVAFWDYLGSRLGIGTLHNCPAADCLRAARHLASAGRRPGHRDRPDLRPDRGRNRGTGNCRLQYTHFQPGNLDRRFLPALRRITDGLDGCLHTHARDARVHRRPCVRHHHWPSATFAGHR